MVIVIVFTIYKNGGNAGVLGASFGCALFGVRGSSGVNAGAQLFGRALFNGGGQVLCFGVRFCGQAFELAFGQAVLIECA